MSKRRSKRRVSVAARSGTQTKQRKWLMYGGAAIATVVVVALAVVLVTLGSGTATAADLRVSMYQGVAEVGGARQINISSLHGKPLILNFWAALCPPCRAEMPGFQQFYNEFKDDVPLLGVDVGPFTGFGDSSHQEAETLLRNLGATYPAGFTTDSSTPCSFRITGMPTTLFINSAGEIFEKRSGALSPRDLARFTNAMLAAEGNPHDEPHEHIDTG